MKLLFLYFFLATKIDLENIIKFYTDWNIYNKYLSTPEKYKSSLTNPEAIIAVEKNVKLWMKSMERVMKNL